jgi:hypothetical protein
MPPLQYRPPRRRMTRRKRRLLDAAETCEALGISLRELNSLMRCGTLRDVVMYGWKPWFTFCEVHQAALTLGRRFGKRW